MRREVNAPDVMLVLSEDSRMLGEVVPSTEEEMLIVRSGWSPWIKIMRKIATQAQEGERNGRMNQLINAEIEEYNELHN